MKIVIISGIGQGACTFLLAFPMCSVALALTFKKSIVLEKNPKQYLTQWELGGLSNTDRVGFRNGIWMLVKF